MRPLFLAGLLFLSAPSLAAWGAECAMAVHGPASFNDCAGRRIELDRPFTRIVSLYSAHTENLVHLNASHHLVGASKGYAFPDKPLFSNHDGLERFLAVLPDAVLVRPMIDRGYPGLVAGLERNGITVISLQPAGLDGLFTYWRILGMICGKAGEARDMVGGFEGTLSAIRKATEAVLPKKRVFFEAIHSKFKTFSLGSMALLVLEAAGGENIAADAVPSRGTNIAWYGKERILAQGPRIDVYLAQVGPMNRITVEEIASEPGFGVIKAVAQGRIHLIEEAVVSRPTPRLVEGIRRISAILYPDRFTQGEEAGCGR